MPILPDYPYLLDALVPKSRPVFINIYGRSKIGKTTMTLGAIKECGRPFVYWQARKDKPEILRQELIQTLIQQVKPSAKPPRGSEWQDIFAWMDTLAGETPLALILDDFHLLLEADPVIASGLQIAWDLTLQHTGLALILIGSDMQAMWKMMTYSEPLYGRFTHVFKIRPYKFSSLDTLFSWRLPDLILTYAILGGVPAYWDQLDPKQSLDWNLHYRLQSDYFKAEGERLLALLGPEKAYRKVLFALSRQTHTRRELAGKSGSLYTKLRPILERMEVFDYIERLLPLSYPVRPRYLSALSHYRLTDPFLRYWATFLAPSIYSPQSAPQRVLRSDLVAFAWRTFLPDMLVAWKTINNTRKEFIDPRNPWGDKWWIDDDVTVLVLDFRNKGVLLSACFCCDTALEAETLLERYERVEKKLGRLMPGAQSKWLVLAQKGFSDRALDLMKTLNMAQYCDDFLMLDFMLYDRI